MLVSVKRGLKKIKHIVAGLLHTAQWDWRAKLWNIYQPLYTMFPMFLLFCQPHLYIRPGRLNNRNTCVYNAEFQRTLTMTSLR